MPSAKSRFPPLRLSVSLPEGTQQHKKLETIYEEITKSNHEIANERGFLWPQRERLGERLKKQCVHFVVQQQPL